MSRRLLAVGVLIGLGACSGRPEDPGSVVAAEAPFLHEVGADGVLEASTQTPITVPSDVRGSVRIAWLAPEGRVESGQVVARFDGRPFQVLLADARHDLEGTGLETTKTRAGASRAGPKPKKNGKRLRLDLEHAETYGARDDEVFSRKQIIESQIDAELASERRRQAVAGATTDERLAAAELAILSVQERDATRRGDEAQQSLSALEVRAPHDGVFVPARNWRGEPLQVGHEVWQGQPVGELPDLAAVRARVHVLEADAGGIKPGVKAEVVVDARPDRVLEATVESIEPVAKPRLRGSPVQYFGVVLAFTDPADVGRPGQRVRARLRLADLESAIAIPRQAIERQDEHAFVWVATAAAPERRPVTLGPASLERVVVTEGLAAGDRVLLEPHQPPAEAVNQGESP